jgi:hypothetical protein
MAKRQDYIKQIGIRCHQETVERCVIAGAGRGEVAGARKLLELGWQAYLGLAPAPLSFPDQLRIIASELERLSSTTTENPSQQ